MKHPTFWIALFHHSPLQKTCILFHIYYTKGCIDYSWKKADAMEFQMKLKRFLKQETVLSVAAVLAVLSMFFVPPDADYLGYIDLRTLAILFSLMTIMAGLRR